ncbi:MAG: alpha/beta hydrolase [Saprospiraceae bacterium]|nr:alpha/beta hydrolase [Saprospiraceae bacterium]
MAKKFLKWGGILFLLLISTYLLGPRVEYPNINTQPISFDIPVETLDEYLVSVESEVSDIKPGNEAKIVWADSTKQKTDYAVVYLHGFSASREEGAPLHTNFAKRYGYNLYLPRLYDHGRKSDDTFKGLLPGDLVDSAKEAIAIGRLLGDKIILMSCSTGGTLAALLAPEDPSIHSMFMYSPNIDVFDPTSELIIRPWGKQMLDFVLDGEYNHIKYDETAKKYWSETYHSDGLLALKYLIEEEMNEDLFSKIDVPVYMGYYYKDEENQDKVVSVPRMLEFFGQIGTDEQQKRKKAFPEAGRHVMTSYVFSQDLENVQNETFKFAEEILNLEPVVK